MRSFLVDVDVVLDVLLERRPYVDAASALWAAGEEGRCALALSAHAVTTVFYLASRHRDRRFARSVVTDLASVFSVAKVDEAVIHRALGLDLGDFEDAVSAAAAEAAGCDAVVTRNLADFAGAPLPALDPRTALAWLAVEG